MKLRIIQKNKQDSIENNQMSEEDENFPAAQPQEQQPSNPMILSGKRKRKPKELIDEVSPILWWTKKKKNQQQQQQPSVDSKAKPLKVYEKRVESKGLRESGEKRKRDAKAGSADPPDQTKSPTLIRAEEFRANLGDDPPNFMKVLVKSHVGSCFWMGLPVPFCKMHLPKHEATVVLEDEDGVEFPVKYIGNKTGLSAGWRKFVTGNKLLEGDILIFQLVSSCRFKMYIIRANDLNEVDGALSLLNLDSKTKQNDADGTTDAHPKKRRRRKSLPLSAVQNNTHNEGPLSPHHPLQSEEHSLQPEEHSLQPEEHSLQPEEHSLEPEEHSLQPEEHSGNDSVASEVLECSKLSKPSNHFEEINTFEDFHITVNGVSLDSEIPEDIRQKYYDLCRSKDTFLHERLLPGLYCKLAAGVIFETVNTAEALRSCKLTTPRKEFEVWEKSLRSFELLGLNVGFLKTRLEKLMSLVFDSESGEAARRHLEVSAEREKVDDEIQSLEAKLEALKQVSVKYDGEIEKLKKKAEAYEKNFQEEVNAPW